MKGGAIMSVFDTFFKLNTSASGYGLRFALFADDSYLYGAQRASLYFEILRDSSNMTLQLRYNSSNLSGGKGKYTFTRPSDLVLNKATTYDFEIGAPAVYDKSGDRQGILFYILSSKMLTISRLHCTQSPKKLVEIGQVTKPSLCAPFVC